MRNMLAMLAALTVVACTDGTPTEVAGGGAGGIAPVLSPASDGAPPTIFNTQLRSALEVPACNSESKGHAHLKVFQDGTIESMVKIKNKADETVRFGHIHHLDPGEETGPIIWWLSLPPGFNHNLTDRHIEFRETAVFVSNPHFTSEAAALAELLDDPSSFYVNFHSNACPGGFARGFL